MQQYHGKNVTHIFRDKRPRLMPKGGPPSRFFCRARPGIYFLSGANELQTKKTPASTSSEQRGIGLDSCSDAPQQKALYATTFTRAPNALLRQGGRAPKDILRERCEWLQKKKKRIFGATWHRPGARALMRSRKNNILHYDFHARAQCSATSTRRVK